MKPVTFHAGLTEDRWRDLSLTAQLGNVGSDIGRAIAAQKRKDADRMQGALDRALELFDLTIADPKNRTRLKELCRAREVVCDFFFGENSYGSSAGSLDRYFLTFATAARLS